jgi:hypothetical protein
MKNTNGFEYRSPYPSPTDEQREQMEREDQELMLHHLFIEDLVKRSRLNQLTADDTFDLIKYADDIERFIWHEAKVKEIDAKLAREKRK